MTREEFQEFVGRVEWVFAKSIPNWPHFHVVEEELDDPEAYAAARAFIRDHGYDGRFFDLDVRYYDLEEWTYWSSPLDKRYEEQYMIYQVAREGENEDEKIDLLRRFERERKIARAALALLAHAPAYPDH